MTLRSLYSLLWLADGFLTRIALIFCSTLWCAAILYSPEPVFSPAQNYLLAAALGYSSGIGIYQISWGKLCGKFALFTSFFTALLWIFVTWNMFLHYPNFLHISSEVVIALLSIWIFIKTPSSRDCKRGRCPNADICKRRK